MRYANRFMIVALIFLTCGHIERKCVFSRSPDGSKQIIIALDPFGDARVSVIDNSSGEEKLLFGIDFSDRNERIMKFSWSLAGSKVAWLISHSNNKDYAYGKRLIVFDVSKFPKAAEKVLEEKKYDITDYELSDDRIVYLVAGETAHREHKF
jgi:hypothetical protein